jgi:hypothetical protein
MSDTNTSGELPELLRVTASRCIAIGQLVDVFPQAVAHVGIEEVVRRAADVEELDELLPLAKWADSVIPPPKPPRLERLGALDQWWRELRAGVNGQHIDKPSTWRIDRLYRAATWEAQALAMEQDARPGPPTAYMRHYMKRAAEALTDPNEVPEWQIDPCPWT